MSDEPSDAQKLIAEVMVTHALVYDDWAVLDADFYTCACGWHLSTSASVHDHAAHVAVEVDKALGGLDRAWAAVWPDDSYLTPWHEKWNFHPNKSARELAEVDVADHEGTTLGSRWSSGWTVTE
ncbi:hypothetical protein [Mycobacteroides abscessus]|uniref:hypothetical protein n=1 Tax=Mycobacteroides abscessus TaxID=36809 RepID=UPI00078EB4C9|nr:hypothetical protein [Mycobacteroides abscessus]AMU20850.1 hypothetical protein A3N95_08560 [Mycobacteroides abscessus]